MNILARLGCTTRSWQLQIACGWSAPWTNHSSSGLRGLRCLSSAESRVDWRLGFAISQAGVLSWGPGTASFQLWKDATTQQRSPELDQILTLCLTSMQPGNWPLFRKVWLRSHPSASNEIRTTSCAWLLFDPSFSNSAGPFSRFRTSKFQSIESMRYQELSKYLYQLLSTGTLLGCPTPSPQYFASLSDYMLLLLLIGPKYQIAFHTEIRILAYSGRRSFERHQRWQASRRTSPSFHLCNWRKYWCSGLWYSCLRTN